MRLELERLIPVRDDVVPARRPRCRLRNMRLELERPLGYHLVEPQRVPLRNIPEAGSANEGDMAREVDMHIVGHPNMFVGVCVELGWLDYTQLSGELCPSSDLRGLLQLLRWTDLSQISCLASSEAYGALRQLVSFYTCRRAYDGQHRVPIPIWPDLCFVCMVALNGYKSGECVMCSNIAICHGCEYAIPEQALDTVCMRRHRWDEQTGMMDVSAVQPGDILCLECCTAGASVEQVAKGQLYETFCNVCDWSFGHGDWHPTVST